MSPETMDLVKADLKKPSKEPVSLESERRKGMILVHYVERDTKVFRNKWLRNITDTNIEPLMEFADYARTKLSFKKPKTPVQFLNQLELMMSDPDLVEQRYEISLLMVIGQRAKSFEETFRICLDRLRESTNDHIMPYCLSFSPEMEGREVKCVHEYENNINRWLQEIEEVFEEIEKTKKEYELLGSPSFCEHIQNYSKILFIMDSIFDVFAKMHEPIKSWVVADEAYSSRVQFELNSILRRKMVIADALKRHNSRVEDAKHKLIRSNFDTKKMHEKLQDVLTERRFCRKIELSSRDDIEIIEVDLELKKKELDDVTNRLLHRKVNSQSIYDSLTARMSFLQEDIFKLENQARKHKQKLLGMKKDRYRVQKEVHRLKNEYESCQKDSARVHDFADTQSRSTKDLIEEQQDLTSKAKSLRRIRQIKLHPDTVKDIYLHGYTPGRKLSFSDPFKKAFTVAAEGVGGDWMRLYKRLPFVPSRPSEDRSQDVEDINLARRSLDAGIEHLAFASLKTWQHHSKVVSLNSLVKTLRRIKKFDTANRVEKIVARSIK
ncbi:hypothetical protein ScPMuIL_005933 [Solemya velum]